MSHVPDIVLPVDAAGPGYLKALRAPLNDIDFVPTGGVTPENAGRYRHAGAFAVGAGSALVGGPDQSIDDLASRAEAFRKAWDEPSSEASSEGFVGVAT